MPVNYNKTAKGEGQKHLGKGIQQVHPNPLHNPMTVFLQPGAN